MCSMKTEPCAPDRRKFVRVMKSFSTIRHLAIISLLLAPMLAAACERISIDTKLQQIKQNDSLAVGLC